MCPYDLSKVLDDDVLQVLPQRDQLGRRIIVCGFGNWKPSKLIIDDIFRAWIYMLEIASLEAITQFVGWVMIIDFKDVTLNHMMHFTPNTAKTLLQTMVSIKGRVWIMINLSLSLYLSAYSRPCHHPHPLPT